MKTKNKCPWCIPGIDNCHCPQEEIDQYYEELVNKAGNTPNTMIRHFIMELQAEEAECVSMCLDKAGVPTEEDGKPLSLWGRVLHFSGKTNNIFQSQNCPMLTNWVCSPDNDIHRDFLTLHKKAAIVDQLMAVVPIRNIETHTIDNLVERIEWFMQDHARLYRLEEKLAEYVVDLPPEICKLIDDNYEELKL